MSLVIIVPASDLQAANETLEQAGFGANNISVPMRGVVRVDDPEQATHWGCHWWAGQELDEVVTIVKQVSESAKILANVERDGVERRETIGFELFDGEAGDYFYIPVDPQLIDGLNIGIGLLTGNGRPYARKIEHPQAWPVLEMREADVVPISLEADPQPLIEILNAFVAGGGLTQEELDGIVGGVQQAAGHAVRLTDFIPLSWQPYIMSKDQATAAGYFGQT